MRRSIVLVATLLLGCPVSNVDTPNQADPKRSAPVAAAPAASEADEPEPSPAPEPTPEPTPEPEADNPPEDADYPEPAVQAKQRAGITLVEAGAEPRRALKLTPSKGAKQSIELGMQMKVAMEVGTQQVPPTPIPSITVVMDLQVVNVGAAIRYRFTTRDVKRGDVETGSARVAQAVDEAVAGLAEAKGTIAISPLGRTESIDLEIADLPATGMKPAILGFRQSFSQLFPAFPQQPVGVGARWKAVSHFEADEMEIQQTATYELVRSQGDDVELKVQFEQVATQTAPQDLAGTKVDVGSYGGTGDGTIALSLSAVAPKKGRARSRSSSQSKVAMGGGQQALALRTELELTLADVTSRR